MYTVRLNWRGCIIALVGCGKPGDCVVHVRAFIFITNIHLNYHNHEKLFY